MLGLVGALFAASFLALPFPGLANVLWGADVLLVLAVLVDYFRTPRPDTVRLRRVLPERAGLSRELQRELHFEHPAMAGLVAEVHEEFPAPFEVLGRTVDGAPAEPAPGDPTGGADSGRFDGDGVLRLGRTYRSRLRGRFAFGSVRLRLRGRLGLVHRQKRMAGAQSLAVEPALANLKQTLRLAASNRWQDLGVRLLRRRGGATEFESLREYVPGDEIRHVDWKAFARRGKPMVRQYQVERGQELFLLIDCGRRMRARTADGEHRGWTKLDWALDAALEIAAVALAKGDRVGAATFDSGLVTYVSPAKSGRQLTRLSQSLFDRQPTEKDSDLARALRSLAARHRRRATVLILSDVADPLSIGRQRAALSAASRRHRLIFTALDDPGLRAALEDSDMPADVRATASELAEDRRRSLRQLGTAGARVLDALPAEAAAPLLAAWLDERHAG